MHPSLCHTPYHATPFTTLHPLPRHTLNHATPLATPHPSPHYTPSSGTLLTAPLLRLLGPRTLVLGSTAASASANLVLAHATTDTLAYGAIAPAMFGAVRATPRLLPPSRAQAATPRTQAATPRAQAATPRPSH